MNIYERLKRKVSQIRQYTKEKKEQSNESKRDESI